jgi:hypothetical protein
VRNDHIAHERDELQRVIAALEQDMHSAHEGIIRIITTLNERISKSSSLSLSSTSGRTNENTREFSGKSTPPDRHRHSSTSPGRLGYASVSGGSNHDDIRRSYDSSNAARASSPIGRDSATTSPSPTHRYAHSDGERHSHRGGSSRSVSPSDHKNNTDNHNQRGSRDRTDTVSPSSASRLPPHRVSVDHFSDSERGQSLQRTLEQAQKKVLALCAEIDQSLRNEKRLETAVDELQRTLEERERAFGDSKNALETLQGELQAVKEREETVRSALLQADSREIGLLHELEHANNGKDALQRALNDALLGSKKPDERNHKPEEGAGGSDACKEETDKKWDFSKGHGKLAGDGNIGGEDYGGDDDGWVTVSMSELRSVMQAHAGTRLFVCVCVVVVACMHTHAFIRVYILIHTHTYIYRNGDGNRKASEIDRERDRLTYINTYVHTYICVYIHTFIHTQKWRRK